jgi:hypothetical protein
MLVLRMQAAAPATAEATTPAPAAAPVVRPAPATPPVAETAAQRQRGRPRKAVADAPAAKALPAASVVLPPTLRAAGRRKPRTVQPPA